MSTENTSDDGLTHIEWNRWLWCTTEMSAFEWQTGSVTWPHCNNSFDV